MWTEVKRESRYHVAAEEEISHQNLTGRPQLRGDTQINRNGLIQNVRARNMPKSLAKHCCNGYSFCVINA